MSKTRRTSTPTRVIRRRGGRSPERFPEDYHEYVFKDGKLVGAFDAMYRHAKEVPWHQDTQGNHWAAQIGLLMLGDRAPYETILEIGCGLGYITAKLKRLSGRAIDAFDVSPEAIRNAKTLHPGIGFYIDDIMRNGFRPKRRYDLVVIRDVFWYVCQKMERVMRNLEACVKPGGFLYVGQSFPALDRPFVGKEIIPTPEALLAYVAPYEAVTTILLWNHLLPNDGPMLHFLGRQPA